MRRWLTSPFAKGFAGAIAAFVVGLLLLHAYLDHNSLHALIGIENQRQEQAKGSAS